MSLDLINPQRRRLIEQTISASTLALVAASGLMLPQRVLAHWPAEAFTAEAVEDALLAIMGEAEWATGKAVSFKVGKPPKHTVSGDSVAVEIDSKLTNIERIAILIDNNPLPLALSLDLTPVIKLPIKTRVKIAKNSMVIAVVRAEGKLYKAERAVRVDVAGDA